MEKMDIKPAGILPVILCGGSGTRLWPLSRELYPKPFIVRGNGRTLFSDTLQRASHFQDSSKAIVICNEEHRFFVLDSLGEEHVRAEIILEPEGRNTAPAAALAALAASGDNDPVMLVMPSDHAFASDAAFYTAVEAAAPFAENGDIVTFGINPDKPETGYGYIEKGEPLGAGCCKVQKFVEKPNREAAIDMLENGHFVWNSGIFLLKASVYLDELAKYAPAIKEACVAAWANRKPDGAFIRPDPDAFRACPEDSIDYAIMEHTHRAVVMPCDVGWSDLGSWDSVYLAGKADETGNVCRGDVITEDANDCYFHSTGRLVAAIGLKNMIVVESADSVLVMPRERKDQVKKIVARLKAAKRDEFRLHPLVHRPWGTYERLSCGDRFQVKRIVVRPQASLSLQLHHHRSEHWIVVRGTAEITIDDKTALYTENSSAYIPIGSRHKLHNPGKIPLELIEVQSGSYLGEDDIVRVEDSYGRK